jgi:hypothetical protein
MMDRGELNVLLSTLTDSRAELACAFSAAANNDQGRAQRLYGLVKRLDFQVLKIQVRLGLDVVHR